MDKTANFNLDLWQDGPLNRWAFQHISDFLTTHEICCAHNETNQYPPAHSITDLQTETDGVPIVNVDVNIDGRIYKLDEILKETHTDSIVILRNGNIVYESYLNGMEVDTRHLLQSVSKSILGVLYARMICKGVIDPEQHVGHYLPELHSSVFGSATIAQALDMQVALKFSEDYASPDSEMTQLDRACGWKTNPTGEYPNLRSFLLSLSPRVSDVTKMPVEHGSEFQYCSATTDMLAWLIAHVSGVPYSELLERELWCPMGAQHRANITVDSEGLAVGNGGISCSTRDMALFGQLIINGGRAPTGEQVIPLSWIEQTCNGTMYKNHWWVTSSSMNHAEPNSSHKDIHGRGIYGQYLWIDQETGTVIAKFSSNPIATNTPQFGMHMALFSSICNWTP
jgi:6-aminohexanoate-oligomer exohydrolase